MKYLQTQPAALDFGENYRNAQLAGSFQIIGARKLKHYKCHAEFRGTKTDLENSVPSWLKLSEPRPTRQKGLAWEIQLDTAVAGFRQASLTFEFDNGTAHVLIRAAIKPGTPSLGDISIYDEPFDCTTDFQSVSRMRLFLKGLDCRVNHLASMPSRFPRQPRTLLLHGGGLLRAAAKCPGVISRLIDRGTNVILLADKFFHRTDEAANTIGSPYGMTIRPGTEGGFPSSEELQRAGEHYSDRANIRRHPLTKGVSRLYWHRPWPIDCASKDVVPLVTDSKDPSLCYVAVAKPKGYVVMVAKSLWSSMVTTGWPFDNDRLFANLLVGGDAEA